MAPASTRAPADAPTDTPGGVSSGTSTGASTWIVTTAGSRPIADVVGELARAGFQIEQVLEFIGSITGKATPEVAAGIKAIRGVADVAADLGFDVGPPDAPLR